eukprot:CAMPEP_0174262364 /NCGR_PEP_ID=MMETSP0439-20130205/12931_1 /TAXON_ID=0 /ORGANISM="Stereomyxa ramosa, Strain Chinc5" /LENGTH=258 /DNA_ID=CAMNT_0015347061 /DNA_START=41 /DNA_END=817 /DNA_ORIENTATION=+
MSNERQPLLGPGGETSSQGSPLDECARLITEFVSLLSDIEKLSNTIGTTRDSQRVRDNLHDSRERCGVLAKHIGKILGKKYPQEKMRQGKMLEQFKGAMKRFTVISKESIQKERNYPLKQDSSFFDEDDDLGYFVREEEEQKKKLLQLHEQDMSVDKAIVQETNEKVKELEGELVQLAEVYADVKKLIGEQGEVLDNVESQVEDADQSVTTANRELEDAYVYQQKSRIKMVAIACICLCLVVVVVAVVIVVVVYLVKK